MTILSERGQEIKTYLPPLYDDSLVMDELLDAAGPEFDLIWTALDELLDQFFAGTATWALDRWEDFVGITRGTGLTDVERQDRLLSRIKGLGTATIERVELVASSYAYGEVDVDDQSTDATLPDYTISVEFINETGIPTAMTELERAVRAVVPAHLAITYLFNWMTWNELDTIQAGGPRTWDQWDTADAGGPYTWDEIEELV